MSSRLISTIICIAMLICLTGYSQEMTWENKRGKKIKAELVRFDGEIVILKKDKKINEFSYDDFCKADRAYLDKWYEEHLRTWQNTNGQELKAILVDFNGKTVKLGRAGKVRSFSAEQLCEADNKYLEEWYDEKMSVRSDRIKNKKFTEEVRDDWSDEKISGSEKFKKQIYQALIILKKEAPEAYAIVTKYVGRIKQGEKSGMWAYKDPPTYEIADRTAFYSVTWCASTIAHDSFHSKLYHEHKEKYPGRVPDDTWTGVEAEKKCLKHQLEVLKNIKAPKHEITYFLKLNGTHHDTNKDGKYDWEDYRKRDW